MITITPKLAGLVAASAVALMAPVAFAANPHKPVKAAAKTTKIQKSVKAAVWSFPACTTRSAAAEYDSYIYSGDKCAFTEPPPTVGTIVLAPAIESGVASLNPESRQTGMSCNGNDEYDYIYSGCP